MRVYICAWHQYFSATYINDCALIGPPTDPRPPNRPPYIFNRQTLNWACSGRVPNPYIQDPLCLGECTKATLTLTNPRGIRLFELTGCPLRPPVPMQML